MAAFPRMERSRPRTAHASIFDPPVITTCPGDSLPPPASGRCEVTAGGDAMLITGDILTPGEVFRGGQVLVGADGRIACVACDCSGMASGATAVVCPDVAVSPGLINGHDHVSYIGTRPGTVTEERFENRQEWRGGLDGHTELDTPRRNDDDDRTRWVEVRQVIAGTTSIFGEVNRTLPSGLARNLDEETLFEGLSEDEPTYRTFPLGDAIPAVRTSCGYDASSTSAVYVPHLSEGIDDAANNEFRCSDGQGMGDDVDLMEPRNAIIHGVGLHAGNIALMAESGVDLIWSPRTNISLYGDTARVTTYAHLGVPIGLGTDWIESGSMNMLRELQCVDQFNQTNLSGFFPDEQIWLMATRGSATALDMDDTIGTIAVGLVADLALFDASARRDHRAVIDAEAQDVVLVVRGGQVLYGDADLVDALETGCDDFAVPGTFADVCGVPKRICVGELSTTFAALAADRGSEYPLFFCGEEPTGEPPCLPERQHMGSMFPDAMENGSNYYSGMSRADDVDGDGIVDASDLCPTIFNPIRPMDDGVQSDRDGDGVGDECDPTPFDASDLDGDGRPNDMDNCPALPNPGQEDMDGDGLGDLCDGCPDRNIPPGTMSVYAVRCGATTGMVTLEDLVVTAVADDGFFAQLLETAATYDGVDYSGIFVFTNSAPAVARGDVVDVAGVPSEFFGLSQLGTPADAPVITPVSSGMTPAPLTVSTADIVTSGPRAEALESVLVRVDMVTAMGGLDMFDEFAVDDGLLIGDTLYLVAPPPMAGSMYDYIQGPLTFAFSNTKILPRDPADLGGGDFALLPDSIAAPPGGTTSVTVVLPDDAPAGGAAIVLTPAPATILVCAPLVIPAGTRSGMTTCVASATEDTGTLAASFGGDMDTSTVTVASAPSLFFSEYVEGSGAGNKALEILNAGGSAADLSMCEVRRYSNGMTSPSAVTLSGTLAPGDVHTICNSGIEGVTCDQTSGTINHNGNDPYELVCMGMVVDVIGQVGDDPGSDGWTGGGLATTDFVLRRMCSVTTGDPVGSDPFDPSVEWTGVAWTSAADNAGLGSRSECP